MKTEFEVKFSKVNPTVVKEKLVSIGAVLTIARHMQRVQTFDFADRNEFKEKFTWARVRQEADNITLTIKEVSTKKTIESVKEIELIVDNFDKACELLKKLRLIEGPYVEKYREKWEFKNCEITIDEWPGLKPFVEIEGANESVVIDTSVILGFDYTKAIFGSVDNVYEAELGIKDTDFNKIKKLTFSNYKKELSNWL